MVSKLESSFQSDLIADLNVTLPGCLIMKNDPNYRQGIPDLIILFKDRWAFLEVKKSSTAPARPNQKWYVDWANRRSYGAFVYPENVAEVKASLLAYFGVAY